MRPALHIVFTLGAALAVADAHAYCVRNALADRAVHAAVVGSRTPGPVKTFSETVAAGKEFCCNPKNADCNPDRASDEAAIAFDAQVEMAPAPIKCGALPDAKAPGRVVAMAPVRGFLRFEPNARFDAHKRPGGDNPPYLLKALTADNKVVATYSCPPRGVIEAPRGVIETPRS
jgi:hypothetical protein